MESPNSITPTYTAPRSQTFTAGSLRPVPPGYRSPFRQHQRAKSLGPREVKETLDACLTYGDEDTGQAMRINQYTIRREIGRGSYGAVHLAEDQDGNQYAIKEFSKNRLRKRSQSEILRRPHFARRRVQSNQLHLPTHRRSASEIHLEEVAGNPLHLIREEIAIMKKLDHQNIVKLHEVLDDPEGDSLYMVMEMCAKGVVMKVSLGQTVEPYPEEQCRHWFRDMILGIEYLHSQGIIHRDIKPENLYLADDDCLKIGDFGVSEMFKDGKMMTAKSAGSPAFLPPELCKVGHGDVSGEAADIWSMGVTLYCLCFGRLPFDRIGVIELYEAIKNDELVFPTSSQPLKDLLSRLLDKNPNTRIKMKEIREHTWVTSNGEDMLLSYEENTTPIVQPTEAEVKGAITKSIRHIMTIVKAVKNWKRLTVRRLATNQVAAQTGESQPTTQPLQRSKSLDGDSSSKFPHESPDVGHSKDTPRIAPLSFPRRMDSAVAFEDLEIRSNNASVSSRTDFPILHISVGQDSTPPCCVSESPIGTGTDPFDENVGYGSSASEEQSLPLQTSTQKIAQL